MRCQPLSPTRGKVWIRPCFTQYQTIWWLTLYPSRSVSTSAASPRVYGFLRIGSSPSFFLVSRWRNDMSMPLGVGVAGNVARQIAYHPERRAKAGEQSSRSSVGVAGSEANEVNPRTPESVPMSKTAAGQRVWDEKWYREGHNSASVDAFLAVVGRIEDLAREHDWQLEPKMNKHYVGFRYGFFNAFGVQWLGGKSFGIFFKLPQAVVDSLDLSGIEDVRYVELWKQLECKIVGKDYPLEKLMPAFEAAYKQVAGR